jgi:hypothetical protein
MCARLSNASPPRFLPGPRDAHASPGRAPERAGLPAERFLAVAGASILPRKRPFSEPSDSAPSGRKDGQTQRQRLTREWTNAGAPGDGAADARTAQEVMRMEWNAAWPAWIAGWVIGALVVLLAWVMGKGFGVSSSYGSLCSLVSGIAFFKKKPFDERWRLWFIAGLPLGGLLSAALAGDLHPKFHIGLFESVFGDDPIVKGGTLLAGGFLVGFGSRWAGGCTSGHSILGIAQGAKSSLVATIGFMAAGLLVTNLLYRVLGG